MSKLISWTPAVWANIGWFGCIYFAKTDFPWLSLVFPLFAWILIFKLETIKWAESLNLLLWATVGILFDGLVHHFGLIRFASQDTAFVPIWLVSMWLLFVAVFPLTRKLLSSKLLIAAVLGIIFGPLTYKSGEVFDVMYFTSSWTFAAFSIFWGLYFPLSQMSQLKLRPKS